MKLITISRPLKQKLIVSAILSIELTAILSIQAYNDIKTGKSEINSLIDFIGRAYYDLRERAHDKIKTAGSELNSLRKKKDRLVEEQNNFHKQRGFEKNKKHIEQKPLTFKDRLQLLPRLWPGKPTKHTEDLRKVSTSGISEKQTRDQLIVEELMDRRAKNPERPIISEANPEQTHANDLAEDFREERIQRVGYSTIRKAWKNRGKN